MATQQLNERSRARAAWVEAELVRAEQALGELAARASATADPAACCRTWISLGRQVGRDLRRVDMWRRSRLAGVLGERLDAARSQLDSIGERARREVGGFDAEVQREGWRTAGLRVAVAGKGGAGKTALAATLARLLARSGRKVAAVDLDTNPGLSYSLGVPDAPEALPDELLVAAGGAAYGWQLAPSVSPADVVLRHSRPAPDGVHFLSLGKIGSPDKEAAKRSVVALQQVLLGFAEPGWDVIGDLEAGLTTPFERYHQFADLVLLVVGPSWRSALTARRLLPILEDTPTMVIGSQVRDEVDHPGLPAAVRIPYDAAVLDAERRGLAPLDVCPGSPAVQAVSTLAERLVAQEVPT